ncbi:hypothetical protein [Streptomyces broussonetiae]|uniref:Uncharacterized protein n=1 Tax=Streptomyces broussonetiae TaxID=2686304 RepID=A0ABV5EMX1_9ACTN
MHARPPGFRETLLLLLTRMLFPARGSHRAARRRPSSPPPPPPTHPDSTFWYDTPLVRPYLRGHEMEVSA